MERLVITIAGKSYSLKFGYGCFRHLAGTWGVSGIQGIVERFSSLGEIQDLSFEQMQLFIDLAYSAVHANGRPEEIESFDEGDWGDAFLRDPSLLSKIVAGLTESMPKAEGSAGQKKGKQAAGKAKASPRS